MHKLEKLLFLNIFLAVCGIRCLSGHHTDLNYITQTPSGTFDNTALTLIQVLNLHQGLAVIYLNYSIFSIYLFLRRQKMTAQILRSSFSSFLFSYDSWNCFKLFIYLLTVFSLNQFSTAESLSSWTCITCRGFYMLSLDTTIWYCVATKHQPNNYQHQANLLRQTFHTSAQNSCLVFKLFFFSLRSPSHSILV